MNPRKFESLPAEFRKAIDETSGQAWVDRVGALWEKWDGAARTAALEKGIEEIKVPDAVRASWEKQLKPYIDKQLADMEGEGVKNARAIYDEMKKRLAQYAQ